MFVTFIITLLILILLVVPIYILFWVSTTGAAQVPNQSAVIIAVLLVATLIFSSVLSAFTKAKRHETLAAAAG